MRKVVTALLQAGMGLDDIVEHAPAKVTGATAAHVRVAYAEVLRQWNETFEEDQPKAKAAQLERIRKDLTRLRASNNPNWAAVAKLEELFAKLAGTFEPARVQIDVGVEVQKSVLAIVATMSADDQQRLIEEQRRLEARALLS